MEYDVAGERAVNLFQGFLGKTKHETFKESPLPHPGAAAVYCLSFSKFAR